MRKQIRFFVHVFIGIAITLFLDFGCLSFAQKRTLYRQETVYAYCDINNPRYCSECKETDKRDFAKCDEVDYRKIDLLKSDRLPDSPPYLAPDYASQSKQAVFAANIGDKNLKSEIFIAGMNDSMQTQKRLTWDADADCVNLDPFFTGEEKVAYTRIDSKNKTEEYFLIEDIRSGRKVEITREQSDDLYLAAHKISGK